MTAIQAVVLGSLFVAVVATVTTVFIVRRARARKRRPPTFRDYQRALGGPRRKPAKQESNYYSGRGNDANLYSPGSDMMD